jgi:hypothetical protein
MEIRTIIADSWQNTASPNIHDHNVLCAVDDLVRDAVTQACRNNHKLLDFDEYRGVDL